MSLIGWNAEWKKPTEKENLLKDPIDRNKNRLEQSEVVRSCRGFTFEALPFTLRGNEGKIRSGNDVYLSANYTRSVQLVKIHQVYILGWWPVCCCFNGVWLFATLWAGSQPPLSMGSPGGFLCLLGTFLTHVPIVMCILYFEKVQTVLTSQNYLLASAFWLDHGFIFLKESHQSLEEWANLGDIRRGNFQNLGLLDHLLSH